jgi:hypothetical protein
MDYPVDSDSFQRNFPVGFAVPPLLMQFAQRISKVPYGSMGFFRLRSERFNDFWIENGSDLHPDFALFMSDRAGGQIGYWLHDKQPTETAPIVFVGSEGELAVVANSLVQFLFRLATGETQVPDLDSRDGAEEGQALAKWLAQVATEPPVHERCGTPDLKRWMDDWHRQQHESIARNPLNRQITENLRRFLKPNAEPWDSACFDVLLVGRQFRMWHRSAGPKPIPGDDVSDLEPVFRSLREQRALQMPERGLWFSAWVTVGPKREASVCCNFMDEPEVLDERPIIPAKDYQSDLRAFPRSDHWMPDWLRPIASD